MNNSIKKIYTNQHITSNFMVLSIILIAFFSYRDMLDYFFTSGDDLIFITYGRIQSFKDIINILTKTQYSEQSLFYRPIAVLSFSLDYSIWKLNPFGYHLTNLIIHIVVSILVFFLVRLLTGGKQVIAWLSSIIFTTHPILIHNVTVSGNRPDMITALFLILSLLLFLKHVSSVSHKRCFLLSSIFFYVLAFGTKEIAIILLPLIFTYLIIFTDEMSPVVRVGQAIKRTTPYFITTLILVAWRAYVLKGLVGGYSFVEGSRHIIILKYFNMLLNPADFLRLLTPATEIFVLPLSLLFISLIFYKRIISENGYIRTIKKLLMTGLILSSISILTYLLIEQKNGTGHQLLMRIMEGLNITSLKNYIGSSRKLFLKAPYFLLFFFMTCLMGIANYEKRKYFFPVSYKGKLITFLLIWLLLPLSVYVYTLYFSRWYMYIPVIPFSIILSVMFIEGLKSPRSSLLKRIAVPAMIAVLILSFFLYSPFRTIRGWKPSVKTASMLLDRLLEIVPELPKGTTIFIYNVPQNVMNISGYGIKLWLDLIYPANNVKAISLNLVPPVKTIPDHLDFEMQTDENNNTKINVILRTKSGK